MDTFILNLFLLELIKHSFLAIVVFIVMRKRLIEQKKINRKLIKSVNQEKLYKETDFNDFICKI